MKINKIVFKDVETINKNGKLKLSFKITKLGILYFYAIAIYKIIFKMSKWCLM